MMFYALVILCLSERALAQLADRGCCPRVSVQPNFDLDRFLGKWYTAERFWHNFEYTSKNNVIEFCYSKNNTLDVTNTAINKMTGKPIITDAIIYLNEEDLAKMVVHMPMTPPGTSTNMWVLGTDYDSYVVLWGCTVYEELNLTYAWILTRNRNPKRSVMTKAYGVFKKNALDTGKFIKVEQNDCDDD